MLKLGPNKNVNAERILFIYNDGIERCVYPAQNFETQNTRQASQVVDEVRKRHDDAFKDTIESIYIERNQRYLYGEAEDTREYTTYWVPMVNRKGSFQGALGIQILETEFQKLIPSAVLEEPYQVSFVAVYDRKKNLLWSYTNGMSELQTHKILKGVDGQPDTFWDDQSKVEPTVDKEAKNEENHEYYSIQLPIGEDVGEEFCDDPEYKQNCLQIHAHESPLLGIDKHANYDEENL